MKVALISDTHGILMPPIDEDTDFIIHAGDICKDNFYINRNRMACVAFQDDWMKKDLKAWHEGNGKIPIYGTWGNHDFIGEVLQNYNHDGIHIYTGKQVEIHGMKVWFSPYVKKIGAWAFGEDDETSTVWGQIPDDTQVIVSHTPPCGLGDLIVAPHISWEAYENVGSKRLLNRCMELKDLRLVICGHIHEGRGLYANEKLGFPVINVAVLDEQYKPVRDPVVYIDWPIDTNKEELNGYGHGV